MSTATFNVTGMHCSSCSMLITMNLEELPGVASVDCDHATGKTLVAFDESQTDVATLRTTITEAGYSAELVS
jgi:copper chaperone CopZ